MRSRSVGSVVAALLTAAGCAASGPSGTAAGSAGGASSASVAHGGPVITQDELAGTSAQTAMDAIKRLRPNFLTGRGAPSANSPDVGIVIYANGMRLGGPSALNDVLVQDIKQIQYLNASEATQRFGTGHPNGAILITRK
ncbi:MAG: hypothetical protein JWM41_3550 [Gemmatimonadetes bacterium]|nr:hypothetical protein [Gemmatimonadota bacterium]